METIKLTPSIECGMPFFGKEIRLLMRGIRRNTKDGYEVTVYDAHYGTVHIYHDEKGRRLTELKRAIGIRGRILDEIKERVFDPDAYRPEKIKELEFDTAIMSWLTDVKTKLAPSTYKKYRNDITHKLIPFFKQAIISEIKAMHIRAFYRTLSVSAKSKKNTMTILNSFFKYLLRNEMIRRIPAFPEHEKIEYRYRKACSWDVFLDIVSGVGTMEREALLTMRLQWLRTGELRALRWEDVLFDEDKLLVRNSFSGTVFRETTKTGEFHSLHLHSHVKEILQSRQGHPKAFVFHKNGRPLSESWLKKQFDKARDEKGYSRELTLYGATRHSAATDGYIRTGDIYKVNKALRHKQLATTMKYTHYDGTQEIIEPAGQLLPLKRRFKRRLSENEKTGIEKSNT